MGKINYSVHSLTEKPLSILKNEDFELSVRLGSLPNNPSYILTANNKPEIPIGGAGNWQVPNLRIGDSKHYIWMETALPTSFYQNMKNYVKKDVQLSTNWHEVEQVLDTLPRLVYNQESNGVFKIKIGTRDLYSREMLLAMGAKDYDKLHPGRFLMLNSFDWQERANKTFKSYDTTLLKLVLSEMSKKKSLDVPFDKSVIPSKLFPAQVDGVEFALHRAQQGKFGTLLAHAPGMGKTLAGLATFKTFKASGLANKCVVFTRAGAFGAWISECKKSFGDDLTIEVLKSGTGIKATNRAMESDIILTNYESAGTPEVMENLSNLCKGEFLILDETTQCKNMDSINFRMALPLCAMSKYALALTATPVVNDIGDMYSILKLVDPEAMPKEKFETIYRKFEEKEVPVPKYKKMIKIQVVKYLNQSNFFNEVAPSYQKKDKDMATFVKKDEVTENISVKGTKEEKICDMLQTGYDRYVEERADESMKAEMANRRLTSEYRSLDVSTFQRIAICSPYSLSDSKVWEGANKSFLLEYLKKNIKDFPDSLKDYVPSKLTKLNEIINKHDKNERFVVFFEHSTVMNHVQHLLENVLGNKREILTIDGTMNYKKRLEIEQAFKEKDGSILMCTDALSMGCNLPFADVLIHYELPWSPAIEKQRSDRIHRRDSVSDKLIITLPTDHSCEKHKVRVSKRKEKNVALGEVDNTIGDILM